MAPDPKSQTRKTGIDVPPSKSHSFESRGPRCLGIISNGDEAIMQLGRIQKRIIQLHTKRYFKQNGKK